MGRSVCKYVFVHFVILILYIIISHYQVLSYFLTSSSLSLKMCTCTTDGTLQSDKSESILPLKEGALVALMLLLLLLLLLFGLVEVNSLPPLWHCLLVTPMLLS